MNLSKAQSEREFIQYLRPKGNCKSFKQGFFSQKLSLKLLRKAQRGLNFLNTTKEKYER